MSFLQKKDEVSPMSLLQKKGKFERKNTLVIRTNLFCSIGILDLVVEVSSTSFTVFFPKKMCNVESLLKAATLV